MGPFSISHAALEGTIGLNVCAHGRELSRNLVPFLGSLNMIMTLLDVMTYHTELFR